VYNDQIKLKGEHEVYEEKIKARNKGREDHQSHPKPKTLLQSIQPPIQTQTNIQPTLQTNQTIQPLPKNTQIWPRVEVKQEE
jgi:hypothetical protein